MGMHEQEPIEHTQPLSSKSSRLRKSNDEKRKPENPKITQKAEKRVKLDSIGEKKAKVNEKEKRVKKAAEPIPSQEDVLIEEEEDPFQEERKRNLAEIRQHRKTSLQTSKKSNLLKKTLSQNQLEQLNDGEERRIIEEPTKQSHSQFHYVVATPEQPRNNQEFFTHSSTNGGNISAFESRNLASKVPSRSSKYKSTTLQNMKIGTDSFRNVKNFDFRTMYKIKAFIGQGGFGKVYKVRHKLSKELRAMKSKLVCRFFANFLGGRFFGLLLIFLVIPKKRIKIDKELLQEFSILKAMDHPNVIRLFELFSDDKSYYLVTE